MSLVGTPITFGALEQDVLLWMMDNSREYCYTAIRLTNATSAAVKHKPGEVIASATLAPSADPKTQQGAFTDALLMQNVSVPANGVADVRALVRGPAICNFDAVVRSSDSETDAQLRTRLANLVANGVQFIREPSVQSTVDLNS
jgi:hypothetical protein